MPQLFPINVNALQEEPSKSKTDCCFATNIFDGTRKDWNTRGDMNEGVSLNGPWIQVELKKKSYIRKIYLYAFSEAPLDHVILTVGNNSCKNPQSLCSSYTEDTYGDIEGNEECGRRRTRSSLTTEHYIDCGENGRYPIGTFVTIENGDADGNSAGGQTWGTLKVNKVEVYGKGKDILIKKYFWF